MTEEQQRRLNVIHLANLYPILTFFLSTLVYRMLVRPAFRDLNSTKSDHMFALTETIALHGLHQS